MSPRPRRALAGAVAALVVSTAASVVPTAEPSHAAPEDGATPGPFVADDFAVELDAPARGRAAVRALGADLPVAATLNGMNGPELKELLLDDSTAWVDEGGRVFFIEPAHATVEQSEPLAATSAPYPLNETFSLHSKPGSGRTIYLDFDGATVSDTAWNVSGLPNGTYEGWSLDSSAGFSDQERAAIQDVWQRVAEDYAPFDVDVTTALPSEDLIERTHQSDQVFGTRVLVSDSTSAQKAICGGGCGGVAYIDVFDAVGGWHDYYQPAWVFPPSTGDNSKGIAEAISHEVGHNLALLHDGRVAPLEDYYTGHDIWAPIMGAGYYRPLTQWSRGSYVAADNAQDDLAVVTSSGLAYRADEAGSTIAKAAPAPPSSAAYISKPTDQDVYALGECSGSVSVEARNALTSPNLDLGLGLLAADGTLVHSAAPASGFGSPSSDVTTGTDAVIAEDLAPGTYYVAVDGTGDGTWTDDGYDDYGSIGAYTLSASGCANSGAAAPSAPVDVVVSADPYEPTVTISWEAPLDPGGSPVNGYDVTGSPGGLARTGLPTTARSATFTDLEPDTAYVFAVSARNEAGAGPWASGAVTTSPPPVTLPSAPRSLAATWLTSTREVRVTWDEPADLGGAPASYRMTFDGRPITFSGGATTTSRSVTVSGSFTAGETYTVAVRAVNGAGTGPAASTSVRVPAAVRAPGAPRIAKARRGGRGRPWTATARWAAPTTTGGATITRYAVRAHRLDGRGRIVHTTTKVVSGSARAKTFRLRKGKRYRFSVRALNSAGYGAYSARSRAIQPR